MKNQNPFIHSFSSLLKFAMVVILCMSAGFIIVTPLWYFSSNLPHIYSITAVSLAGAVLLWKFIKICRKTPAAAIIKIILNILLIAAGIVISVKLVFNEEKIIALLIFICSICLSVICSIAINHFFLKDEA